MHLMPLSDTDAPCWTTRAAPSSSRRQWPWGPRTSRAARTSAFPRDFQRTILGLTGSSIAGCTRRQNGASRPSSIPQRWSICVSSSIGACNSAPVAGRPASRIALPSGLVIVARIVGASLLYLVVLTTSALLAYILGQTVVPDTARGTFGLLGLGFAEAAAMATVLLLWHLVDRRPIRALGLDSRGAVPRCLRGAAIAALMMGFVVFVGYTLIDGATWDVNPDPVRAAVVLIGGLVGYLIQGPAEEVLFRGYILENVRSRWGIRPAIVVASLTFGLLHAPNPGFGLLPFVNLVLFGVATALFKLYVDEDQLWGVFGIHAVWNWLQQVVFGLPNSGVASVADNALFTISPNTALPEPIWGGGFGPEGTLGASLVLLALIGVALRRQARRAAAGQEPLR